MELTELLREFKTKFNAEDVEEIKDKLYQACVYNNNAVFDWYINIPGNNLEEDNLQKIYQYYLADRKKLKQDYTPKCLAQFMAMLSNEASEMTDYCCGTGALTIQTWGRDKNLKFELYEIDDNVIPFLLFNMLVRNIECTIYNADVLLGEIFKIYKITKGEKFGRLKIIESSDI